ncbi:LytR/AlgR family response regulator transcription factor [Leadbetterella byssophila]|jgi:two-component system LytT family response regulator|uniref:Two component transcriptional regulator, LytTR family n=1 Tax=Leadbetterella byssophila (strain DSM 17132 / JCM 16389 / KACC 11308 / NBRC 106382 / 4M15) TaxID=649349 RepID=E4RRZ8_LEAB4|nr:LytTR family DNA-binding domain-containing protein [Leadbetterella byssophila]ADQ18530.1 two component transcriptional regulator, LytTR family [Leadbetterella byssophila DSM 17132]
MKLRCIVVDDEPLGRNLMVENIHLIPFLELVGTAKNAFEALKLLDSTEVDLIFLDIQMPGMTGTKFVESLTRKPMIIFVTAYEEFAVESYNLEVIDYLMKPVSIERFTKAANKAYERFKMLNGEPTPSTSGLDYMFVNVEYSLVKVNFDTITHIEGLKDYIKIFVNTATHPILTKSTLKGIEEKLPTGKFLRVQKSFIVNLDKIESIRNHRISIGKYEIPVSDSSMESLLEAIKYNK